jgi:hypothetical protein
MPVAPCTQTTLFFALEFKESIVVRHERVAPGTGSLLMSVTVPTIIPVCGYGASGN